MVGRWCNGETFSFSLSQSFFSLCNLPQRKVSTQLQTGYNGSQRVTTGPNGLERVPSQRVPTGLRGEGGEERSMTRLLSPQYFNNIIFIIYLKKFYFYSYFFSLCNNPPFENIYKKKNLYIFIYVYIFIYKYIQKLIVTKKFHCRILQFISYIYIIIIIIKISRNTSSLSAIIHHWRIIYFE